MIIPPLYPSPAVKAKHPPLQQDCVTDMADTKVEALERSTCRRELSETLSLVSRYDTRSKTFLFENLKNFISDILCCLLLCTPEQCNFWVSLLLDCWSGRFPNPCCTGPKESHNLPSAVPFSSGVSMLRVWTLFAERARSFLRSPSGYCTHCRLLFRYHYIIYLFLCPPSTRSTGTAR